MPETPSNPTKKEARAAPRYPVRWPVELESGMAETRDISTTGMFLRSEAAFERNATIRFSVLMPERSGVAERLECEGYVTRVEQSPDGWFGVAVALNRYRFCNLNLMTL